MILQVSLSTPPKNLTCSNTEMGFSENNGIPKSSILIGFSIIFTIHFGVPLFLEAPKWRCFSFSHGDGFFSFQSFFNVTGIYIRPWKIQFSRLVFFLSGWSHGKTKILIMRQKSRRLGCPAGFGARIPVVNEVTTTTPIPEESKPFPRVVLRVPIPSSGYLRIVLDS